METTDWDFREEQGRGEGKGGTAENDYDDEREENGTKRKERENIERNLLLNEGVYKPINSKT